MRVPGSGLRPLFIAIVVLVLSAAFLAGPARDAMDVATALTVLLHIGLGVILIVPAGWALVSAAHRATSQSRRAAIFGLGMAAGLCALTGIHLTLRAATGHSTARESLSGQVHIVMGTAVCIVIAVAWFGRRLRKQRLATSSPLVLVLAALLTGTQGALFGAAALLPRYDAEGYYRDLTATNAEQARNPIFPSGITLPSGDRSVAADGSLVKYPASSTCGETGCHSAALREWKSSAHHLAGTDPFYRAVLQETVRASGPDSARWCQSCHAPYTPILGLLAKSNDESRIASEAEGVGCFACHATVGTPTRTGRGRFALAAAQDYPFATEHGWKRDLHDFLLRVRPGPHQRAFLKPELHRSAEFCSGCHRQGMTVAQNHYQFVRGPDEYGEWSQGSASGRTARTADGSARQTCQDCHFRATTPGTGFNRVSHASPGGNTALAAMRGEGAGQDSMAGALVGKITLDIFALRREGSRVRGEAWIAPLDSPRTAYELRPGDPYWLDVVVRNQGVGHSFPAGYMDLSEAWVEVVVTNALGRNIASNGSLQSFDADLSPDTHTYASLGLDHQGKPILRHNLTDQVTVAYQRSIRADGSDIARYRLIVPSASPQGFKTDDSLRITARLYYRSLRPSFAKWALDASPPSGASRVPVFTPPVTMLAETSVALPLRNRMASRSDLDARSRVGTAERFTAYGRGLLAPVERPDIGGAIAAFQAASKLTPDRQDPWLELGRAYLREPDLRLAAANLEHALQCSPGSPAAIAELGVVYNKQGQPDRSIRALTPLVQRFPNDAGLQYDLGLALFRAGRYREAAAAFRQSLAIDPDNPAAHFELKRCCESLRITSEARREDSVTRYMAENPVAPQLVAGYLKANREAARRAEALPVHVLRSQTQH